MRKALLGTALVAALAMPAASMSATKGVSVKDNRFSPKTLTIKKGSTVVWRWSGRKPHNVKGRGLSSRTQVRGTYRKKFRKKGSYSYRCTLHRGMTGKVVVR